MHRRVGAGNPELKRPGHGSQQAGSCLLWASGLCHDVGLSESQKGTGVSDSQHRVMAMASTPSMQTDRDHLRAEKTMANACVQSQHTTAGEAGGAERGNSCPRLHGEAVTELGPQPRALTPGPWLSGTKVCFLKKGDDNEIKISWDSSVTT